MAKRYQRGNQSPFIDEKKNRQHNGQKIPTGVIRIRSSKRRTDKTMAKRKCTKGQTRKIRCTEGVLGVYTTCTNNIKWHVDLNVYAT
jgi:hypothetical protein